LRLLPAGAADAKKKNAPSSFEGLSMHSSTRPRRRLLIVGIHNASEGYPNVRYRLDFLRAQPDLEVQEINIPLCNEDVRRKPVWGMVRLALRALIVHSALLVRLIQLPKADLAYVPYPAPSVLLLLACLPRWKAPGRVLADIFISLYDTAVIDRRLSKPDSIAARLLFWFEQCACRKADLLIVDTINNASYLSRLFRLPAEKISAIPLSTNEVDYQHIPYHPEPRRIKVLFIGTLIPLHGVGTIIEAAAHLRSRDNFEFLLIGDGQTAPEVEHLLAIHKPNLIWQRTWQTPRQLAAAIAEADICLGIFGDTAKAQRVCPYKLYAYASIGRAIITARSAWLTSISGISPDAVFATVKPADPEALANEIVALADNPARRSELAIASRRFYETTLSNAVAHRQLKVCLEEIFKA